MRCISVRGIVLCPVAKLIMAFRRSILIDLLGLYNTRMHCWLFKKNYFPSLQQKLSCFNSSLASGYIMVWRTLLYVMQWWLFREKVRVVSLLGHPREIRELRDYGEMFSDISDIHFSTYSKQWIKLGFWMLKTLFTCLLYSMSIWQE